jgi:hypothetical protein
MAIRQFAMLSQIFITDILSASYRRSAESSSSSGSVAFNFNMVFLCEGSASIAQRGHQREDFKKGV